jgi:hypothetical protein
VKVGKVPTASTAVIIIGKKAQQNGSFPGGRYSWERSVSIPWRSITHGSTARKKVLQTSALRAVRAMRSVLCDAC